MRRRLTGLFFLLMFLAFPLRSEAKETPAFLSFSLGLYNSFDTPKTLDARLEYRPKKSLFINELRPWAGLELTPELSLWAGAGVLLDLKLADNIYLTPSFGMGYYARGKGAHDLHYPLEFRSQLELAYAFENQARLSLALSHLSNASLGPHNPGVEVIGLYYHLPIE